VKSAQAMPGPNQYLNCDHYSLNIYMLQCKANTKLSLTEQK